MFSSTQVRNREDRGGGGESESLFKMDYER